MDRKKGLTDSQFGGILFVGTILILRSVSGWMQYVMIAALLSLVLSFRYIKRKKLHVNNDQVIL